MLISAQLLRLSQILRRLTLSEIVIPAQREELVEVLSVDMSDGLRRISRAVSKMEAMIGPEALQAFDDPGVTLEDIQEAFGPVRVSTAEIVDLSTAFARELRDRRLSVIEGGAQ